MAAVVAVGGAASVLGLLDRAFWGFELATVFRVQYAVVLAATALAALAVRLLVVTHVRTRHLEALAASWHGSDVGSDHFPLVVDLVAR